MRSYLHNTSHMVKARPGAKFSTRKPAALSSKRMRNAVSHTVNTLTCGTDYRFRGMGYGSPYRTDYGDTAEVTSSIPCPAPTPANVIATPVAQDMIEVSWDTQEGVTAYRVQYAPIVPAGSPAPTWTTASDKVAPTATAPTPGATARTSFTVDSLICGTTYRFKVSGKGDGMAHSGITYSSFSFGAASDPSDTSAAAATDFFCTPQNLNVTPLAQRRARLSWEPVDNAERYFVQVRQGNLGGWSPFTDFAPSPTPSVPIELDNIMTVGGSDVGLAHASAYQFQVRARVGGGHVTAMAFSTPVAIVDSPIKSINGDSSGVSGSNGKMVVKLEWAANRQYTIRYRKLPDNHHQIPTMGMAGWQPTSAASDMDWTEPTPTPTVTPNDSVKYVVTLPEREKVYAVQASYTDGSGLTTFAARERYVWPSNRAAGNGERVATFPVKYRLANKTYYYRICENSFPQSIRVDLEAYIDHAFSQWELATDDWVSFEHDDSLNCEYYLAFLTPIRESIQQLTPDPANLPSDAVIEAHVNGLLSQYRVVGIITPARVARALAHSREEQVSEIYMIDDESLHISDALIQEISTHVGHGWCRSICTTTDVTYNDDGDQIISHDIKVRSSYFEGSPLMFPGIDKVASKDDIRFNACPWSSPSIDWKRYKGLVHEAGHALGIGDGTDGMDQDRHHPQIEDALMSYTTPDDYDCSPHPFDIMAIFALYQTIP